MSVRICGAAVTLALGIGLGVPAHAQGNKPTVAIMPTQYFAADADSAKNITQGLREQFERQGYNVVEQGKADSGFQSMGLQPSTHYADRVALRFGKSMGADLVAYPRLLALGLPGANGAKLDGLLEPQAVIHVRVLNTHSMEPIYFRQVGHAFTADAPAVAGDFHLPQPVASETASSVTSVYFERVAGSRQELRMSAPASKRHR